MTNQKRSSKIKGKAKKSNPAISPAKKRGRPSKQVIPKAKKLEEEIKKKMNKAFADAASKRNKPKSKKTIPVKSKPKKSASKKVTKVLRKSYESSTKVTKKAQKSTKAPKITTTGYHQYLHELSKYYKENGIKLKGRGAFFHKGAEIWKDLKGKPGVLDNIDVILPQFLTPPEPEKSTKERMQGITESLSPEQFMWWSVKNLYGAWSKNKDVNPQIDKLFVIDVDGLEIDISEQNTAFTTYKSFDQAVESGVLKIYSYLGFEKITEYKDAISVYFLLNDTDEYALRFHEKEDMQWSDDVRKRWLKKRAKADKGEPVQKEKEKWMQKPEAPQPAVSTRLNDLIAYKQSLMDDIKFSKEMGEDFSSDMVKLKETKAEIELLMKK
jgi:hypothetical protein